MARFRLNRAGFAAMEQYGSAALIAAVVVVAVLAMLRWSSAPPLSGPASGAGEPEKFIEAQDLSLEGLPVMGDAAARLIMVEVSDFQCPFCRQFVLKTLPEIRETFVRRGTLVLGFDQLPLEGLHPFAFQAAVASKCASRQGLFWQAHDALFATERDLKDAGEVLFASIPTLQHSTFQECVADPSVSELVRGEGRMARRFGVNSTPSFLIGYRDTAGQAKIVCVIAGAQPASLFRRVINRLLADHKPDVITRK